MQNKIKRKANFDNLKYLLRIGLKNSNAREPERYALAMINQLKELSEQDKQELTSKLLMD
jgi:hypothetical protein